MDGQLLASNISPPFEPLPPATLEQLSRQHFLTEREPHHRVIATLPKEGPPVAYAVIVQKPPPHPPPLNCAVIIGLVLGCTAITSVAFARTLAVPLQRLAEVARSFGKGMLDVRTGVRRRDELGEVAEAFDEMAERITHLLRSQKELIANVSHELRTPLARIRVALDLAAEGDAELARESLADITTDLSELERLVADVLTAAKLDLATGDLPRRHASAAPRAPWRRQRSAGQGRGALPRRPGPTISWRSRRGAAAHAGCGPGAAAPRARQPARQCRQVLRDAAPRSRLRAQPRSRASRSRSPIEGIGIDARTCRTSSRRSSAAIGAGPEPRAAWGWGSRWPAASSPRTGAPSRWRASPASGTTARIALPAAPVAPGLCPQQPASPTGGARHHFVTRLEIH